uniref:Uncharacterized protein n=1 Tax=Anguilla anguilla TaxID=7936 RepID=A0A0E9QJ07_ANGAN
MILTSRRHHAVQTCPLIVPQATVITLPLLKHRTIFNGRGAVCIAI